MLALLALACSSAPEPSVPAPAATAEEPAHVEAPAAPALDTEPYRQQAKALLALIQAGAPDPKVLAAADELTRTGRALLPAVLARHPECSEYFAAIEAAAPTLRDLPLERIESGYHADGELPATPGGACYHGKDLVVHPATVAAMAKGGLAEHRSDAELEIVEVLEHLSGVE